MTQLSQILSALKRGEKLTPLEALNRFGTLRLGARIYDLKQRGVDVKSRKKYVSGKYVAEYSL